tara:strand:- start:333 stop:593 length:261 start_codon:yes stop_codon:yes gene_type:complete
LSTDAADVDAGPDVATDVGFISCSCASVGVDVDAGPDVATDAGSCACGGFDVGVDAEPDVANSILLNGSIGLTEIAFDLAFDLAFR